MIVGIDIGGSSIKGILTDKSGKIYSFREIPTPESAKSIDIAIYELVEYLATSATVSKIDLRAIGIGAPGSVDRKKGVIIASPNIPAWKKYPLVAAVEKRTGLKVFLENDATVALVGAWWKGNGSRFRNWLMITLGTGIGGGAIIDNKIYTGQSGNSLEIGHTTIDYNGRECACGNRGCLETYASAPALVEYVRENLEKNSESSIHARIKDEELTAKIIHEEAQNRDELALSAFEEIAEYLGIGISNLINIFSPEAIIIGGGLSAAYKLIIPGVKKVVSERAICGLKENVKFFPIKDPLRIPSLGAAKIAIDYMNES